jgi:hypothetical protein
MTSGLIEKSILSKVLSQSHKSNGKMSTGTAFFEPQHRINHRLVKRFVGLAKSYNWRSDRSLLVLRDVLGLRRYVRTSFIAAISAVTQSLVHYAQYTPADIGNGSRALFVIPDQIYVSTIAKSCNVSRYTVYRVLDYLCAIGDCVTTTKFCPEKKEYFPTKIILTSTLFTRIGMEYSELAKALKGLEAYAKDAKKKENEAKSVISSRINKELRPSVRRRLGLSTERLLTSEIQKADVTLISNPNFLPDTLPDALHKQINASMVNSDRKSSQEVYTAKPKPIIEVDKRWEALRKKGLTISEANAAFKKLIYESSGKQAKKS